MAESIYIHNSHNVSNLVYHFMCPTKYRRVVVTEGVDECVEQTCAGIELRYDWITFLEIGADQDHVHFLIQSTLNYSPSKIISTVKSITAKRVFAEHPEVKKQLWGGAFWSEGYLVANAGKARSEGAVRLKDESAFMMLTSEVSYEEDKGSDRCHGFIMYHGMFKSGVLCPVRYPSRYKS